MRLVFIALFLIPSISFGADYYAVSAGANQWPHTSNADEFEASTNWEPALLVSWGKIDDRVRSEWEFSYRRNESHGINPGGIYGPRFHSDGNRAHGLSLHHNWSYDLIHGDRFSLYGLAGIGTTALVVRHEYSHPDMDVEINDEAIALSAQVGGGIRLRVSNDLSLTAGYHYLRPMDMGLEWEGYKLHTEFDHYTYFAGITWRH